MTQSWAFNIRAHAELLAVVDKERQSTVYDFVYRERDRERDEKSGCGEASPTCASRVIRSPRMREKAQNPFDILIHSLCTFHRCAYTEL